jgi:tetratricopeptide (TPR) repeat protein
MPDCVISREKITIPTYELNPPEPIPVFYDMRNHQGTRGNVYPYPMIDTYKNRKSDHEYESIRLENEFIRVVILPELGGRIYEGYNKKLDYNFVYKNTVIKPAMIGLCGAWLSGGIEFNWPTHHRPTTFMPVDAAIVENKDGSKTAWMGEIEALYGLKSLVGVTVWPDRAYINVKSRVYNPTPETQTFHWWANLAVHANESYQLKFPPDIDYITFHYKNVVSAFPRVTGEFAAYNFGKEGVDITWYKNIPSLSSFFIFNSNYNFMGGYDHGKKMGTVHVADRHISPGKKFFTWGTNSFGQTWQKNLTDHDGPYIEIMTGCYTDNQPDFSFIGPDETKIFEQNWYAIDNLPDIKNATVDAAVSLALEDEGIMLGFNTTAVQKDARVLLKGRGETLLEKVADIEPGKPFTVLISNHEGLDIKDMGAFLYDSRGLLLVDYEWRPPYFDNREVPKVHVPARKPEDIAINEELYLEGLQIEQYHHPLLDPFRWYVEGLRRDPHDSRCNNAMGLLALKRGSFIEAAEYFNTAIQRLTKRNFNPADSEALYNLGMAFYYTGDDEKALNNYRKAAWSVAWKAPALRAAAVIYLKRKQFTEALSCAWEAYSCNSQSLSLRLVLSVALRKTGGGKAAADLCRSTMEFDPLDLGARFELAFAEDREGPDKEVIQEIIRGRSSSPLELAGLYLDIGFAVEALRVLSYCDNTPLTYIYMAYALDLDGKSGDAPEKYEKAEKAGFDFVFPARDREIQILSFAINRYKEGALAPYYLGCLYYGRGNSSAAIPCWEEAVRRKSDYYPALRCLAIAYYDRGGDFIGAFRAMEKAFSLRQNPRYLLELLQISKVCGKSPAERLGLLERYSVLLDIRDDLYKEYITLLNLNGSFTDAVQKLKSHLFHPYEGGEGILVREHILAHVAVGHTALGIGNYNDAIKYFTEALEYPENYGEGRKYGVHEAHVHYHLGLAHEKTGNVHFARKWYTKAATQEDDTEESGICKSMALRKLDRAAEAQQVCRNMLTFAESGFKDLRAVPYFANFPAGLPFEQSIEKSNHIKCLIAQMYGYLGLGDDDRFLEIREKLAKLTDITPWVDIIRSDIKEF